MANDNHGLPVAVAPPTLTNRQWYWMSIVGVILVAMAVLQLFSFSDFSGMLAATELSPPKVWAAVIVGAELWAAASFFKLRLSYAFRAVSRFCAGGVAIFWLIQALRVWMQYTTAQVQIGNVYKQVGVGFFGSYLYQLPSWWTLLEALVLLIAIMHALEISRTSIGSSANVKVSRKRR